jgi:hypothetical protein
VNKERQRKLEARARRQESLANAFPATPQEPKPVKESKQTAIPATEKKVIKNKVAVIETKRGRGRPPKSDTHLKVKQTSKGKEKRK